MEKKRTPVVWQILITICFILSVLCMFLPSFHYGIVFYSHSYSSNYFDSTPGVLILLNIAAMIAGIITVWLHKPVITTVCASILVLSELITTGIANSSSDFSSFEAGWCIVSLLTVALFVFCILAKKKTKYEERTQIVESQKDNTPEELIKFKQLLDNGVITQEEYNAKKKQLLGL